MPICGGMVRCHGARAGIRLLRARFVRPWRGPVSRPLCVHCPTDAGGVGRTRTHGPPDAWAVGTVVVRSDYANTWLRTSAAPITATQTRNATGAALLFGCTMPAKPEALRPAAPVATQSGHPLTTSTTQATPSKTAHAASTLLSPRRRRAGVVRSGTVNGRSPYTFGPVLRRCSGSRRTCSPDAALPKIVQ